MQFADQKSSLEGSLRAARREADCLREQLRHAEAYSSSLVGTQTNGNQAGLNSIPPELGSSCSSLSGHHDPVPASASVATNVRVCTIVVSKNDREL